MKVQYLFSNYNGARSDSRGICLFYATVASHVTCKYLFGWVLLTHTWKARGGCLGKGGRKRRSKRERRRRRQEQEATKADMHFSLIQGRPSKQALKWQLINKQLNFSLVTPVFFLPSRFAAAAVLLSFLRESRGWCLLWVWYEVRPKATDYPVGKRRGGRRKGIMRHIYPTNITRDTIFVFNHYS